jgi:hypothetical protein
MPTNVPMKPNRRGRKGDDLLPALLFSLGGLLANFLLVSLSSSLADAIVTLH